MDEALFLVLSRRPFGYCLRRVLGALRESHKPVHETVRSDDRGRLRVAGKRCWLRNWISAVRACAVLLADGRVVGKLLIFCLSQVKSVCVICKLVG